MIRVDLITGFLGSGKTTFLKKYARYFMDKGLKVGILENDYGAVNVDMLLLNELRGEKCELEMVAGACDASCHARRFKTKLISMAMSGYDRVLIEPSGLFDIDEFFDVLHDEPLDRWYEIGSVIVIVDARLEDDLSEISDYYLASQTANAGILVLSRTQLVDDEQIEKVKQHIKRASEAAKVRKYEGRPLDEMVMDKNWDDYTEADFEAIESSGYSISSYVKKIAGRDSDYSSIYFLEVPMTRKEVSKKINILMNDDKGDFGSIFRIKGFIKEEDRWYQVNATKNEIDIMPIDIGQEVIIVIGEILNKENIEKVIMS